MKPLSFARMRKLVVSSCLISFSLTFAAVGAFAESEAPLRIKPARGPVALDGRIDEFAWTDALTMTLDYATWPVDNEPAPVRTVVRLMYDDANLYLGFRAFDDDPDSIRARFADHDRCWRDDLVGVKLDTFNDGRRSLMFISNPIGAQYDAIRTNENGEDSSWDAIWTSIGTIDELGFSVEMAIPFSSLRFQRSEGDQVWGVHVSRTYPRDQRYHFAAKPYDRNNNCEACQFSKVIGFAGVQPGSRLAVTPTLTALASEARDLEVAKVGSAPLPHFERVAEETELGLTATWGMTTNLTLAATFNPDFSTVEADAPQIDINEPFAIFFPEKRPFFTEGADFFRTPMNLVYTRTVRDPSQGMKLTGKEGRHTLAAFVAEDEMTNLIIPGVQESEMVSLRLPSVDSVVRYSRDLTRGSNVGAIVTSRNGDDYFNHVAGFDSTLRVTGRDTITAQVLASTTQYPEEIAADFTQVAEAFDGHAFELAYSHETKSMQYWADYSDIADGFRADMGFMPQVGFREVETGVRRTWYPQDSWVSRFWLAGSASSSRDQEGGALRDRVKLSFYMDGQMQSCWNGAVYQDRTTYNGQRFELAWIAWWNQFKPSPDLVVDLQLQYGDHIDYANTRAGTRLRVNPSTRYFVGRHFQVAAGLTYESMKVAAGRLYTANIARLSATYQFTPRTLLRAVVDGIDYRYDVANYDDDRDPRTTGIASQLLFSYRVNPQTSFFAGYSDRYQGDHALPLTQSDRTLFVKLGYAWSL